MAETLIVKDLSAVEQRALTGLRKSVTSLSEKFGVVRESAREIAPRVMRLFNELAAKHENLGGFVGFARLFDSSIPTHAADKDGIEGYRKHKVYYTLDYMRRLVNIRPRGQQGRRDPALDQLARTIATVLQIVKDPDPVWSALTSEFRFSPRMVARLKSRVESVKPVIDLSSVIKPINLSSAKIIHMEPFRKGANNDATETTVMEHATAAIKRRPGRPRKQVAA